MDQARDWSRTKACGLQWVVTGHVPYNPCGRTLAEMMRTSLFAMGLEDQNITIGEGVGIASEARNFMARVEEPSNAEVYIVSSNWYLWPGKIIWKRHAKKAGVKLTFVPVYGTGGVRTRILYFAYFLVVLAGKLFGFSDWLENRLTKSQEKRKTEGFTWDGCA